MSEAVFGHFEVTRAKNAGQKDNPHGGQFDKWYVGLKNLDGGEGQDDAYWQRQAPSEVTVGDKVYGKLEEGQYGWRFRLEPEPDAPRGGGGRETQAGTKGGDYLKPRLPEEVAEMRCSHAQEMAVRTLTAMGAFNTKAPEQLHRKIDEWTTYYEQKVREAGQAASQAQGPPRGAESPPGQGASPGSGSPPVNDEHQWFKKLLETANLNSDAAHTLANYMVEKFDSDQKKRAERGLENFDTQAETLKKLEAAYEKQEGKSLPSGEGLDDVPF